MNSYDEIQCEELNEIDAYDQMMWVEAMESREASRDEADHEWDEKFSEIDAEWVQNQPCPW